MSEPVAAGAIDEPVPAALRSDEVAERPVKPGKVGAVRTLLWQSRAISGGINGLMLGFLTIYATDTLKVPAALVGTLLLVAKVFDAIAALTFGPLVDRTNTRWGRARPYEWSIIGLWLCTWLMFTTPPEWQVPVKAAWIFVMFTLVTAVFNTFLNATGPVYLVRAFPRTEQHVMLSSIGGLIPMFVAVAFNISFPIMMSQMATSAAGWSALVGIWALPLAVIGMLRFFFIKETVDVDVTTTERLRLKDVGLALRSNSSVFVLALLLLVFNMILNMGVNVFYFTYIVHNVALMGLVAAVQIIGMPIVFIFPSFVRRFSIRTLVAAGLIVIAFGYFLNFFAVDNIVVLAIAAVIVGVGSVPISMVAPLMVLECADYNEWKGIPRMEGTIAGLTNFGTMLGAALGAGMMGWLLSASGYTGDAATMPDSATFMIRALYSLIPMAIYLVMVFMLRFYKLTELLPQIRRENEERRATARLAQEPGAPTAAS